MKREKCLVYVLLTDFQQLSKKGGKQNVLYKTQ